MTRSATFLLPVLVLLLLVSAGCGGSSAMMGSNRQMQSLIVTPSSADAQKFPNNQVQFMANATFNMAPMSMMSPAVHWSIGNPFATPMPIGMSGMATISAAPTINANGVAQCNGFVGIVTVEATAPADPSMGISQMNAMTRNVSGMAQLICP
jgi:hypothetical protein